MDQHEIDLLEKHAPEDPELKSLWDDHLLYENPSSCSKSRSWRAKPSSWISSIA